MNAVIKITELLDDGIGPGLILSVHQIADTLPTDFIFDSIDWSLEIREQDPVWLLI